MPTPALEVEPWSTFRGVQAHHDGMAFQLPRIVVEFDARGLVFIPLVHPTAQYLCWGVRYHKIHLWIHRHTRRRK